MSVSPLVVTLALPQEHDKQAVAALPIEAIDPSLFPDFVGPASTTQTTPPLPFVATSPEPSSSSTYSVAEGNVPRPKFPTTKPILSHMPPISASRLYTSPYNLGSKMDNVCEVLGYGHSRFTENSLEPASECERGSIASLNPFVRFLSVFAWFLVPSLRLPCSVVLRKLRRPTELNTH